LSTLVNGFSHASSLRAISPQNASGSSIERLYRRSYSAESDRSACALNPGGGGNLRASRETDLMTPEASEEVDAAGCSDRGSLLIAHLPYFEGAEVGQRGEPFDIDESDACARWALAQVYEEGFENGLVALRLDLDRSIGTIADPALHAQAARFVRGRGAITDALHPPAHDPAKALHDARWPLGSTLLERRRPRDR